MRLPRHVTRKAVDRRLATRSSPWPVVAESRRSPPRGSGRWYETDVPPTCRFLQGSRAIQYIIYAKYGFFAPGGQWTPLSASNVAFPSKTGLEHAHLELFQRPRSVAQLLVQRPPCFSAGVAIGIAQEEYLKFNVMQCLHLSENLTYKRTRNIRERLSEQSDNSLLALRYV